MELRYGPAGWVRLHDTAIPGKVYVRLGDDGRVTDVWVSAGKREVTPAHLRRLPLTRYQAQANSRPDLLYGMMRTTEDPEVAERLDASFPDRGRMTRSSPKRLTPPTSGLTTDFLREVAAAYQSALARGERPNLALAEQTGYGRRTVERWVYLSRKAGLLPPTKPGAAR